jgi:NAD(P)-dependent dehydrogenase (short-subunit alcohol dehydrogenase family)
MTVSDRTVLAKSAGSGLLARAVVAVTGAGSGIGRATAVTASREGAAGLVLCDLNGTALADLIRELSTAEIRTVPVVGSVADHHIPDRIVDVAVTEFGRLDLAVNNAGLSGTPSRIDLASDELFDDVFEVNVRAVFRCMRAQLRQMYAQGSGAIVNIASASVFGVAPGLAPYCASKSAVITLSSVAAKESGPRGVRVNVVAPGRTMTPLFAANIVDRAGMAAAVAAIPLGRLGEPGELADAIVYLGSNRASFVNGSVLTVDGGRVG